MTGKIFRVELESDPYDHLMPRISTWVCVDKKAHMRIFVRIDISRTRYSWDSSTFRFVDTHDHNSGFTILSCDGSCERGYEITDRMQEGLEEVLRQQL